MSLALMALRVGVPHHVLLSSRLRDWEYLGSYETGSIWEARGPLQLGSILPLPTEAKTGRDHGVAESRTGKPSPRTQAV